MLRVDKGRLAAQDVGGQHSPPIWGVDVSTWALRESTRQVSTARATLGEALVSTQGGHMAANCGVHSE